MPKTNDGGGASAAGFSGIVEHAAPIDNGSKFSEVDPELHLDGTLKDGDHPDHPKAQEREILPAPDVPQPIDEPADQDENEDGKADDKEDVDRREDGSPKNPFSTKDGEDSRSPIAKDQDASLGLTGDKSKDQDASLGQTGEKADEKDGAPSVGTSSATSSAKTAKTTAKR